MPTIYHWYTAVSIGMSTYIVPLSNLGGTNPAPVGRYQGLGPFGTYDMAGNVRDWCWNTSNREVQSFLLGGGWNDPPYAFDSDAYTQPPFDRSASNGFRCIKYLDDNQGDAASARTIVLSFRDYFAETPSSDKEFEVFLRQYAYDQAALNASITGKDTGSENWIRETVSFDAAYGGERVMAHLFLPRHVAPPYQVVFHWPGDSFLHLRSSDAPGLSRGFDFIIKSGRAVMFPVSRSMFERADGLESTIPNESNNYREHVVMWIKDVRRSIDYLQTRPDIDTGKLAYFGYSWGGRMAGIALAVDNRFKTAVLYVAGFRFPRSMPEVDPFNFVSRVKIPVIMLNGRYDHYFPVQTAQKPLFTFLGRPKNTRNGSCMTAATLYRGISSSRRPSPGWTAIGDPCSDRVRRHCLNKHEVDCRPGEYCSDPRRADYCKRRRLTSGVTSRDFVIQRAIGLPSESQLYVEAMRARSSSQTVLPRSPFVTMAAP